MKRVGKPVFFVVAILVVVFLVLSLTGISTTYGDRTDVYIKGGNDIRWGIDIRGGVDVTFTPPEDVDATETQMKAAEAGSPCTSPTAKSTPTMIKAGLSSGSPGKKGRPTSIPRPLLRSWAPLPG